VPGAAVRAWFSRAAGSVGSTFFFVAAFFAYYGQFNRVQTGDTWGTIYTAVALVRRHAIWLDSYIGIIQQHAGVHPYMVTTGPGGHLVNVVPSAASLLALPVVAVFSLFGVQPGDFGTWMEAGMLTAALTAAGSVAVLHRVLTRLTSRRRAALVAATYAFATLEWGVSGQALWQHSGATLALSVALLAFVDGRPTLAGAALASMVAFRPNAAVIFVLLLPLVGRQARTWARFALGLAPFVVPLLAYNAIAFGSPFHQGYGSGHLRSQLTPDLHAIGEGLLGLVLAPGRGLLVYSPVLVFAAVGLVRSWRIPLYLWAGVASGVYVLVAANSTEWYGGQSFGPRRLTDALPLLVLLLVPALDAIAGTRWTWAYGVLLAWSLFVELLGAAAWPPTIWFDKNPPLQEFSTWWHVTDNELVSKLGSAHLPLRLTEMVLVLVLGLVFGYVAQSLASGLARSRSPA
jgi:hypothetical protein